MEVNSNSNFNYGQKLAVLFVITGIIFSVAWLSPHNRKNDRYAKMIIPVEKQVKILNKNYKIKINSQANADLVIAKQKENAIRIIPVKPTSKKLFTTTEANVQVAQNFNLAELPKSEVNQPTIIPQQSKETKSHSFEKYNKLLNTKEAPNTTSLFRKDNVGFFFKSIIANTDKNHQHTFFNFQKLQTELEKNKFSFLLDVDQMQNEIKNAVNPKRLNELILLKRSIVAAEIEDLIRIEVKKLANRSSRYSKTVNTHPRESIVSNYELLYRIDSLSHGQVITINKPCGQSETRFTNTTIYPDQYNSTPGPLPKSHDYSYDDDFPANAENANKKSSAKGFNKPNAVSRKQTWGMSIKPGISFRIIPNVENPSKVSIPKPATQPKKADLRIEYKKGVIVINGEKIDLPNVKELVAHLSAKNNKLTSTEKDFDIQINY